MFIAAFTASTIIALSAILGIYEMVSGPYPFVGALAIAGLAAALILFWYDAITCDTHD